MKVKCDCKDCKHNIDGWCEEELITITDEEMTAAGFLPLCTDYEEQP